MRGSVDVRNHLLDLGVSHEVFLVRGRLRTPERVAAVLGLPTSQVGRVVVFESGAGPIAVLVSSERDADPDLVARAAGVDAVAAADPSRASHLTGYLPEAIPPVALPPEFLVLMDERLAAEEVLYFRAGAANAILKIRAGDLAGAGAKVAGVAA